MEARETPRTSVGEPYLGEDPFLCVLEALGYSETLALCACLSKNVHFVAKKVANEARQRTIEASGGLFRDLNEKRVNRFEGDDMNSWWTKWTVVKDGPNDARYVFMRESDCFVAAHFPKASIGALSSHFPVFKGDHAHQSIEDVCTRALVPYDLQFLDFSLTNIGVTLRTRDPCLHIFVGGVLQAGIPNAIGLFDEAESGHFAGDFACHAFYVRWVLCGILPMD